MRKLSMIILICASIAIALAGETWCVKGRYIYHYVDGRLVDSATIDQKQAEANKLKNPKLVVERLKCINKALKNPCK